MPGGYQQPAVCRFGLAARQVNRRRLDTTLYTVVLFNPWMRHNC
jgi:hypothetical protein